MELWGGGVKIKDYYSTGYALRNAVLDYATSSPRCGLLGKMRGWKHDFGVREK